MRPRSGVVVACAATAIQFLDCRAAVGDRAIDIERAGNDNCSAALTAKARKKGRALAWAKAWGDMDSSFMTMK